MNFLKLNELQYKRFFVSIPYSNFWQSVEMAHMHETGNDPWDVEYVGVVENRTIKAVASLHSKVVYRGYRVYMIPRGLLIDYKDEKLLRFFLQELLLYLKEKKCLFVRMDPYVEYQKHLPDGSIDKSTLPNNRLISLLKSYGFNHLGFRTEIDNNYEPRWLSVLSLTGKTEAEVLKQMDSRTRQNINYTIRDGIKLRELGYEELEILYHMVNMTGTRKHFDNPSLSYYQNFYQAFKSHKKVLYAYLDTEDYLERNEQELLKMRVKEKELYQLLEENPKSKKNQGRLSSLHELMTATKKRIQEAKELHETYGREIPLAAALFVIYPSEIVYLFSGSDARFKHFKGSYAIQWEIIRYALKEGIPRYNFYGISGTFDKNSEEYGVFLFKRGFHTDVIELVGDFKCIVAPQINRQYELLHKIKDKLKR